MKVDNRDDRQEMPEECDGCGYMTKLERFYQYGPGHNVNWYCRFCANSTTIDSNTSNLFNELLEAIKEINSPRPQETK